MPINVRTLTGETVTLSVHPTDTISEVEFILQRKEGIFLDRECLFFGDKPLTMQRGECELSSYNIQKGSTLHLAYPGRHGPFTVIVKHFTGKTIDLVDSFSSDTIQDLKEKIQDKEGIPPDQQLVMFHSSMMKNDHTLLDCGIDEWSRVHLLLRLRGGSGAMSFADVSNSDAMAKMAFSKNAPSWKIAAPGLCLEGRCTKRACKAYGKMVILNNNFDDFDLARGEAKPCPKCEEDVTPITCAFNNCVWSYKGKKAGERQVLTAPWTEVGDSYHRFEESNEAEWERLLIQARPKPVRAKEAPEPSEVSAVSVSIDYTWEICTICLDHNYWCDDGSDIMAAMKVLQCGHHFHSGCIADWAKDSSDVVCPNCRQISPM